MLAELRHAAGAGKLSAEMRDQLTVAPSALEGALYVPGLPPTPEGFERSVTAYRSACQMEMWMINLNLESDDLMLPSLPSASVILS